jgi:hypothetical protein
MKKWLPFVLGWGVGVVVTNLVWIRGNKNKDLLEELEKDFQDIKKGLE